MTKRILEIKCRYCGKTFVAQRSSAKYCHANCRKAYSRILEKMEASAEEAAGQLWNISKLIEKRPEWRWYAIRLYEFVIQEAEGLRDSSRSELKEGN